ncbi:MAG: 2-oxoacid:acceptor oxidoreductase family protein [Candidatus Omnitrophota bacterium]
MKKPNESIICAGFGGQGIMVLGRVLANAGMKKGYNVTWMPSYGAEVRGGTAHSMVKMSDKRIASPLVPAPDTAFIMSGPSLDKFEKKIKKGGMMILNTSMVKRKVRRKDLDVTKAPLTGEAIKLGNVKVANMIAIGIYVAKKKIFDRDLLFKVIEKMAMGHEELILINIKALEKGIEIASNLA